VTSSPNPANPHQSGKFWSGNNIRETFLRFFESKGHRRVRSSSLVPHGDPTLLFTNAGMNQFKDVFLGLEKRDYNKATTAQKCVRAGGKHNDLENVGFTKRHHTFFEMLGNFSFGDYFKDKAIPYAWELVTSPDWFAIDKAKLHTTVFGGAEVSGTTLGVDEEARQIWLAQNVPADRVVAVPGLKDNFWAMGDTGPCGPCSEIFYDMGPAASGEGHSDCKFPCDCGRYVEIWNLVFMQFNRDASGRLTPLPKPSVDTGMGLERTAAVLQGVISNYDTDLFEPLLRRASYLCRGDFDIDKEVTQETHGAASLRVIVDHSRAATFLIADGVLPSNEGRGYVLRKILRRAIRHGRLLGQSKPFLHEMVNAVREIMVGAYPEISEAASPRLTEIVLAEEQRFGHTLDVGLKQLDEEIARHLSAIAEAPGNRPRILNVAGSTSQYGLARAERALQRLRTQSGENLASDNAYVEMLIGEAIGFHPSLRGSIAFRLYDTYGLPLDFISDVARDLGLGVDESGFQTAMEEQRARARASWKGANKETASSAYVKIAETFKT
jgi:alanyl-tRNA synthetase